LPVDCTVVAARRRHLAGAVHSGIVGLDWRPTSSPLGGLEPFIPLLEVPGIRWVALPAGAVPQSLVRLLAASESPMMFEPAWLQDGLESLAERLAALDLLVSTEDLAATLAGAVGLPVWKIVAATDHWSWLADTGASKWHPTARIFRTGAKPASAIADVRDSLATFSPGADRPGVFR
jgi:hypothetical protein